MDFDRSTAAPGPGLFDPLPAARLLGRHRALTYPYECTFGEASLVVRRGVFCPTLTNTSGFLLTHLRVHAGERVLDAFSGCGAFGIVAALRGATSVLVDVSELAVGCAVDNARRNGVAAQVEVRRGTVDTVLRPGETFECIIANPPLLPGAPEDDLARAVYDPGLAATPTFVDALPAHLAPHGRAYLLTSDVFDRYGHSVPALARRAGLDAQLIATTVLPYEEYRVHLLTRGARERRARP